MNWTGWEEKTTGGPSCPHKLFTHNQTHNQTHNTQVVLTQNNTPVVHTQSDTCNDQNDQRVSRRKRMHQEVGQNVQQERASRRDLCKYA
jgi:hypothetical protein